MKNIYKYSVFCGSLVLASCNNEDKGKQGQNSKKEEDKKKKEEKKEEPKKEEIKKDDKKLVVEN